MGPRKAAPELFSTAGLVDSGEFRKRFLLRLVSHPLTVWPLVLGISDLLGVWVFDLKSGPAVFAGIFLVLASLGVAATRLTARRDTVAREVLETMQKESRAAREKALDDLAARLATDGDPRTETLITDLRALARAFQSARDGAGPGLASSVDIMAGVEAVLNQCVASLEKTLQLWYTARQMAGDEARSPILQQREAVIAEIGSSIVGLGKVLVSFQGLGAGQAGDPELERARAELDQSLEVAKKVAERMKSLDREIGLDEH